tara:strand:+ start:119 stop:460 length:342 start_codon:yes stop_codon:yes gene_type:complete
MDNIGRVKAIRHHQLPEVGILYFPGHLNELIIFEIIKLINIILVYRIPFFGIVRNGIASANTNKTQTNDESFVFVYSQDKPTLSFLHGLLHWFSCFALYILGTLISIYAIKGK